MTNKSDVLISIDIGLTGAISFFDFYTKELCMVKDMQNLTVTKSKKEKKILDIEKLLFLLEIPFVKKESAVVLYEDVHAFPGQGVVAVATLLEQKGIIRGISNALGYVEFPTSPKLWQGHFGMIPPSDLKGNTVSKTKALRKKWLKEKSIELAIKNFPDFSGKLDKPTCHGRSDSMLMGKWFLDVVNTPE